MQKMPPGLPEVGPADEGSPAVQRFRHVGTEILADRSEREATALLLAKDADARKRTEQPVQGVGMGPGRISEFVATARAVGEQVGDAERRGNVDRLRHPVL